MVAPTAYQMNNQTQDEENRENGQKHLGDKRCRSGDSGEPKEGSRDRNQEKQNCCS
jgi:hypothetical protein